MTANIVGQKKVLPSAYTASASMAETKVVMPLTRFRPTTASEAQITSRPMGESLSLLSMKWAEKRSANIKSDVKTNRILPWPGVRILPVMF